MTGATPTQGRGQWSGKFAFVLAAAGSAVGLGNIWKFPSEVAQNGGAAFLVIYLACCFLVGFPVMVAELAIGRRTHKNPVGAFKALSDNPMFGLIGLWGIICGVMILSYYAVVAGWALSFSFGELFHFIGNKDLSDLFMATGPGLRSAVFAVLFMLATITIVAKGVNAGIERAAKLMMPTLIMMMIIMIGFVLTRDGASQGLVMYLKPDFSHINTSLIFSAMSQSFFSLSLGMGALITYGSYLGRKQNLAEVAAYVTLADVGIAFLAGLLIMPAMFMAQHNGIEIFDTSGQLIASTNLVFQVLPALFSAMGGTAGLIFGVAFFVLLSLAALTSTISLLEVPTSFGIDELGLPRKKAAWLFGGGIAAISVLVSYQLSLSGTFDLIFNKIGLPLGGMVICLFLAYVWKTRHALDEIEHGFAGVRASWFGKIWPIFVGIICPVLIFFVFVSTIYGVLGLG